MACGDALIFTFARARRPPGACHTPREELGFRPPGCSGVVRALADPMERVGGDRREAPADRRAVLVLAVLNDIVAARAAKLAAVHLAQRVAPQDVPGVERRIVDAQRGAV